jgi:hypothetical protein
MFVTIKSGRSSAGVKLNGAVNGKLSEEPPIRTL